MRIANDDSVAIFMTKVKDSIYHIRKNMCRIKRTFYRCNSGGGGVNYRFFSFVSTLLGLFSFNSIAGTRIMQTLFSREEADDRTVLERHSGYF